MGLNWINIITGRGDYESKGEGSRRARYAYKVLCNFCGKSVSEERNN